MNSLRLNETPVRTSSNFNINNIQIENINTPDQLKEFKNVTISNQSTEAILDSNLGKVDLKYGLGEFFTEQVNLNSNYKANIIVDSDINKEIELDFKFDNDNLNLVENIAITANENAKSTVILKYSAEADISAYHNGVVKAIAKNNAELNIIIVNLMNDISNNFLSIENDLGNNSKINYYIIDFGGKNSITNYFSNIVGKNADNQLNTIYFTDINL